MALTQTERIILTGETSYFCSFYFIRFSNLTTSHCSLTSVVTSAAVLARLPSDGQNCMNFKNWPAFLLAQLCHKRMLEVMTTVGSEGPFNIIPCSPSGWKLILQASGGHSKQDFIDLSHQIMYFFLDCRVHKARVHCSSSFHTLRTSNYAENPWGPAAFFRLIGAL